MLDVVVKPSGGDAGFWVLAAAMLLAGAGFAVRSYASARRPAVGSRFARS